MFGGFTGLLMLGYAYFQPLGGDPDLGAVYVISFDVFNLTLYVGGTLLLVAAALGTAGIGAAALLDAVVSCLSGVLMLACAACWTVFEGAFDLINLMILIFGLVMARSGIRGLASYRAMVSRGSSGGSPVRGASRGWFGTQRGSPSAPVPPVAPERVHPASMASSALPNADEAPPEEGYLAALSKEQDDPPSDRDA